MSTMKCDAQQAIETYHHYDDIEDCLKTGLGDCNMDSIAHAGGDEGTLHCELLCTHCAERIASQDAEADERDQEQRRDSEIQAGGR